MQSKAVPQPGLLEEANGSLLYIDEVNFTLIGTMNPEEGGLRPQLLDRCGLMVSVTAETNEAERTVN